MKKGNVILIIVCIIIITIGIITMPTIYKWISKKSLSNNKIDVQITEEKKEATTKITLESEILKELVYPIMHNDINVTDSYYKMDNISVTSFSNNDILYNAFLQIYSGYLVKDSTNSISFSSNYLESRIKNIFGPNTGYNLTDFTVPTGSMSEYVGVFRYNSGNDTYVLEKNSNTTPTTTYYDIKKIYDVTSKDENTINTLFYVAFIKIENGKYTLYRDYNYTDEISSGNFNSLDDVANMLDKLDTKKYQYTFRKDTCNYDSYCFYEGKWING